MRSVAVLYSADPELVSKDFTVEMLYNHRPKRMPCNYKEEFKLGETIVDFSFCCIEYDMVKAALDKELGIRLTK